MIWHVTVCNIKTKFKKTKKETYSTWGRSVSAARVVPNDITATTENNRINADVVLEVVEFLAIIGAILPGLDGLDDSVNNIGVQCNPVGVALISYFPSPLYAVRPVVFLDRRHDGRLFTAGIQAAECVCVCTLHCTKYHISISRRIGVILSTQAQQRGIRTEDDARL